jgi:hypothetical protein
LATKKKGYESEEKFKIPAHFGLHARTQSRNLATHFILFFKCKKNCQQEKPKKKKKKKHYFLAILNLKKKKPNSLNLARKKKAAN